MNREKLTIAFPHDGRATAEFTKRGEAGYARPKTLVEIGRHKVRTGVGQPHD